MWAVAHLGDSGHPFDGTTLTGDVVEITEYERHQLFAWFEEHMGQERAATMVNMLPSTGWADVATKRDLADLAATTKADLAGLAATTKGELAALETRLTRSFVSWMLTSQAVMIAVVGLLVGLG